MRFLAATALLCGLLTPCFAQKDFLTSNEVEQVREAQEPNARLKLYVLFARQRLDQLQKVMEKEKKGRSLNVRDLLGDYSGIVEAMDAVSDDALKHHVDLAVGSAAVSAAEKRFLAQLQKIQAGKPADLDLYELELTEAIETTNDSMELALNDPTKRAEQLTAEDKKAKEERDALVAAEDALKKKRGDADDLDGRGDAKPKEAAKPTRRPPTLLRSGEKEGDQAEAKPAPKK